MPFHIENNASLKSLNTFGVEAHCRYLVKLKEPEQIQAILTDSRLVDSPRLILGGGSNILFREDFPGTVILVKTRGTQLLGEDDTNYFVRAAAGKNWHEFVQFTIDQGWAGLENLSLIPGTVGAAPMQNIGAYGVELEEHFHELTAFDLTTGKTKSFDRAACKFGYRDSLFKRQRGRYLITDVTFKLPKKPEWKLDYAGLREMLDESKPLSARVISNAVCQLRKHKLPNPAITGNAGSFFKNPHVSAEQFQQLKADFPEIPGWPMSDHAIKVSAAWLIEQCGWKGKRHHDACVSEKHALVLVNYGRASGTEIWHLAEAIIHSVEEKFTITLQPEPLVL